MIFAATTTNIGSNAWFQGLNDFSQLTIIVGLVRMNGPSQCSTVLRHPITLLWLGEVSMSLYLVTFDGSRCTAGRVDLLACRSGWDEYTAARKYLPYYSLIAACFYYGVREPVRKHFKVNQKDARGDFYYLLLIASTRVVSTT